MYFVLLKSLLCWHKGKAHKCRNGSLRLLCAHIYMYRYIYRKILFASLAVYNVLLQSVTRAGRIRGRRCFRCSLILYMKQRPGHSPLLPPVFSRRGLCWNYPKLNSFILGGGVGGGAHPSRGAGPTNVSLIISVIFSLLFCNSSQKYL